MLCNDFQDEKRKKLASLIRLYINMLRSGKLVTADIVGYRRFIESSNIRTSANNR